MSEEKLGQHYLAALNEAFPGVVLDHAWQTKDQLTVTVKVNYLHLKKQASEETSLKTQASNQQVLSFPAYPGDILCHVCKRDPVARQATPVFHR